MIWLGEERGFLSDWVTQRWVQLTGRKLSFNEAPWLLGPTGLTSGVGVSAIEKAAKSQGLVPLDHQSTCGLIPDFTELRAENFDPGRVSPGVRAFYEQTSRYEIDVRSEWKGLFRPFGSLLARIFGRRLQQLNVPLSPLDTSLGIASSVTPYVRPHDGKQAYTAWIREIIGSGDVLYAAAYSTTQIPGHDGPCVKVVFPLPNGNAIVIMRPLVHEDGSMSLVSQGFRFGDPGFYFTITARGSALVARYLRSFRDVITVYEIDDEIRANQFFTLWDRDVLYLRYRMTRH
jgi:hypothetical protein